MTYKSHPRNLLFTASLLIGCGQPIELEDDGTDGMSTGVSATGTEPTLDPSVDSSGDGTTDAVDPPPEGGLAPWGFGYVRHPEIVARWVGFAQLDDGDPIDVFAKRTQNSGTSYLGDGAGGFEPVAEVELPDWDSDFMRAGDFDGDGDEDIAVFNDYFGEEFTVLLNGGEGSFAGSVSTPIAAFFGYGVSSMRFDEDAAVDLFIPDPHRSVSDGLVALAQGDGSFAAGPMVMGIECFYANSAAADFDGDSLDEVIATGSCNSTPTYLPLLVYRNVEGSFEITQTIIGEGGPVFEGGDIRLLDVDGDDDLDIVLPTWQGIYVIHNEGNGTFADTPLMLPHEFSGFTRWMIPIELGPDGRLGFVLEYREGFTEYFAALVIPDETWTSTTTELLDLHGKLAGSADVDGDGAPDLAVLEAEFDNEGTPGELAIWLSGG